MTEIERIADQLKRSFEGNAWHGPAVREVLKNISAAEAVEHPIPGAHSIWELTMHIGAWEGAAVRRLNGDRAELADEEDWAPLSGQDENAWQATLAKLEAGNQALIEAVAKLEHYRLDEPILEGMPTVYVTLHGVVQHNLYHAGQIAILKRALAGRKS